MDNNNMEPVTEYTEPTTEYLEPETKNAESAQVYKTKSSSGTVSLIFAIVGLALDPCCGMGLVFGNIALILGAVAKSKDSGDKKANIGFILGFVAIGLAVFTAIIELVIYNANY